MSTLRSANRWPPDLGGVCSGRLGLCGASFGARLGTGAGLGGAFALACLGIIDTIRIPMILLLLVATARVILLGRCSIASLLKHMPWNRNEELRLN